MARAGSSPWPKPSLAFGAGWTGPGEPEHPKASAAGTGPRTGPAAALCPIPMPPTPWGMRYEKRRIRLHLLFANQSSKSLILHQKGREMGSCFFFCCPTLGQFFSVFSQSLPAGSYPGREQRPHPLFTRYINKSG